MTSRAAAFVNSVGTPVQGWSRLQPCASADGSDYEPCCVVDRTETMKCRLQTMNVSVFIVPIRLLTKFVRTGRVHYPFDKWRCRQSWSHLAWNTWTRQTYFSKYSSLFMLAKAYLHGGSYYQKWLINKLWIRRDSLASLYGTVLLKQNNLLRQRWNADWRLAVNR